MSLLPSTKESVMAAWAKYSHKKPRQHLGVSLIGHKCDRHIYHNFRWYHNPVLEGRVYGIFDTGLRFEDKVCEMLEEAGMPVSRRQERQQDKTLLWFSGQWDGTVFPVEAPNTEHVLEVKSASDKNWNIIAGAPLEESHPQYYCQTQGYMGMSGLKRALFVAVNKNTDEWYAERIHYNGEVFKQLRMRAAAIIGATEPPQKLSENPAHWECKMCSDYPLCHGDKQPDLNCRTCCHADFNPKKIMVGCNKFDKVLTYDEQLAGCKDWEGIEEC